VIDPSDGIAFAQLARGRPADIDAAVASARAAGDGGWGRATATERGRLLARWAALVERDAQTLALLESRDVGKPRTQALADARALARYLEYYAGAADKLHGQTLPFRAGTRC
jgi:aldehyde dehydrogenase (NAD+)